MSSLAVANDEFDMTAAEAFTETVGNIINSGAVAVMLSIGHRTGLFDTMAALPPSTSEHIAKAADLSERYVREWLAVMVTGGIVTYDPTHRTYALPAEHAACLTRNAPLGNMAVYAQFVPMAGSVQEKILHCFETGDGVSYGDYPCFHAIMAEDSEQTVVAQLFDTILPLAPGLQTRLAAGIDVLDAGCGSGKALIAMAKRYPASRFTGYDLSGEAIASASKSAEAQGLTNVTFTVRDLTGFSEPESYDFITSFDAIHDQKDPQGLVSGIYRSLRPGGVYLVQDIGGSAKLENNLDFPFAAFLYTASTMHCTPVSIAQGGAGLGTMWGWDTAETMLKAAGFQKPERHVLPHDPMNVWFVAGR
ncbi:MAG TPA: class I SAM-dependent methyltransferase [Afifellaceae bacterium]|nr:class I SAM-dependent methyltransferase [Afifellaceae bacterium]